MAPHSCDARSLGGILRHAIVPEAPAERRRPVGVSNRPEVSVIVPTNLDHLFLREAVASVVNQTYEDWEVVVVVNGCTGDFTDLPAMDRRVQVHIASDVITGESSARNFGAFRSTGRLVAFLDHDDVFLPDHLALQVGALDGDDDAGLCFGKFRSMDAAGHLYGPDHGRAAQYVDLLRAQFTVLMSTVTVRRSVLESIGGFDPLLVTGGDLDFILRVAHASSLAFVPRVITHYRRHGGNASGDPWTSQWDIDPILRKHRRWARRQGRRDLEEAATEGLRYNRDMNARSAYDAARFARKEGAYREVLRSAAHSLVIDPLVGPTDVVRYVGRLAGGRRSDGRTPTSGGDPG